MSLFDTDADAATLPGKPDAATVRFLEGYNYDPDKVRLWTREKANAVLWSCRREERIALNRAAGVAHTQEEYVPRGQPTPMERLEAAAAIEQAIGRGVDELCQCVMYTMGNLTDAELRDFAGLLVIQLRVRA